MKISVYYKGLHWPHLLFFTLTPLVAIASGFWIGLNGGFHWGTVLLALAMLIFCGLSTTGGYHRLFAHKSYRAKWPVRLFFLLFGAAAFQGSARWWASGHRIHHKKTDTEQDPYGINKGFWFAHIGWLFTKDQEAPCDNVADLDKDFLIRWQARLFPLLAVGIGWFLPGVVASFWGDFWGG
ncbi:MAG: acyl-CoA desaturase, partial [bacterium]|nr:acyl-CoA desaturase [bacterium]